MVQEALVVLVAKSSEPVDSCEIIVIVDCTHDDDLDDP